MHEGRARVLTAVASSSSIHTEYLVTALLALLCDHHLDQTDRSTSRSRSTMTSAVILGATGQTGRYLLSFLTTSPSISSITEVGRRSAKDAGALAEGASVEKIKKLVSPDLAKPDEAESKKPELQGNDVVYVGRLCACDVSVAATENTQSADHARYHP